MTALHRDNYENLYVQVRGRKHFVLFPALCAPVAKERPLPPARYARGADGGLELVREEGGDVPFPTWDPDGVSVGGREGAEKGEGEGEEVEMNEFEDVVEPLRVTLEPGDMLYLPAMWWVSQVPGLEERANVCRYHKVSQSCADDDEGFVLAVNYWYVHRHQRRQTPANDNRYDMEYSGSLYSLCNLVRNMKPTPTQ